MEEPTSKKENEKKHKGRFMGKLFKQEKKPTSELEVDEFLHGPSDKLYMMPTSADPSNPPSLTRINTASARRWPTAAEVNASNKLRGRSASPKRSRKGLAVRFCDGQPEVIGEGGDEATSPVSDITLRKRAQTHPPIIQSQHQAEAPPSSGQSTSDQPRSENPYHLGPIPKTQTSFEWAPEAHSDIAQEGIATKEAAPKSIQSGPDRRSFAERVKAEMRSGEGLALVQAVSRNSLVNEQISKPDLDSERLSGVTAPMEQLHINTINNVYIPPSPAHSNSGRPETPNDPPTSNQLFESPAGISRTSTLSDPKTPHAETVQNAASSKQPTSLSTLREAALAVGDGALEEFSKRTAHMFTLFRLSAEAIKPISKCTLEDLIRTGLWWFLKGRLELEATIRDRPASPQAQQNNLLHRQQAYADLAKSLWIVETVTSTFPETQIQSRSPSPNPQLADILESRQGIVSGLRKLSISMSRNNFLPPNTLNAPLTQGLDAKIWVQNDGDKSLLASQRLPAVTTLSEALPLGDTTRSFHFARMFLEAIIIEDSTPNQFRCPILLSLVRGQREKALKAVITNQDGSLNLAIQSDKSLGPTWADVKWQANQKMIEVRLPRGFALRLYCSELDFKTIRSIYDYENRIHGNMLQRPDEQLVFESTVRAFQYFEQASHPIFAKDPQPQCHLRIYEKTFIERAATGPRTMHRGFRICLVTNPKTKNLRGIDQDLVPNLPILFNFLRGDGDLPALMLKIYGAKSDDTMVFTFDDIKERTHLHKLLTGTCLADAEEIIAESPVRGFSVTARKDMIPPCLKSLDWQGFSFINHDFGDIQGRKTVLSEQLRVAVDFKIGTILDRINVSPGELKFRLDVTVQHELKVLRQPQQDMTISISESQSPKGLAKDLASLLDVIKSSDTTRIYTFPSKAELHLFQSALTGFVVLFDGVATSFNISRRRMVVPIYKKWDAAHTRLQIVQKEKVLQLVAFFEGFSHGECMNFALKSTDIFESSTRGGKYSVRIVDAKFALPKPRVEDGIEHEFVCLDMPEYPGEHDDITILFEDEASLELFSKALPAPVKVATRMPSVRR